MKIFTTIGVLAVAALFTSASTMLAKGVVKQTANVVGQGPTGPIVAEDGATVTRTKNGVGIALTMPTPQAGSYDYPPPNPFQPVPPVPGTPEVFTGWAFIFNQPENCAVPNQCVPPPPGAPAPNDFTTARGGVYNFAGHPVSGGGALNLVGQISVGGVAIRWTVRARKSGGCRNSRGRCTARCSSTGAPPRAASYASREPAFLVAGAISQWCNEHVRCACSSRTCEL